jgi:tetratricopeptide (TPR) repeat protein
MPINSPRDNQPVAPTLGRVQHFALAWKAKILLLFGMQAQANEVFADILRRSPGDVYAMNSLGYAALLRKDNQLAHSYFAKVRELTPTLSNAQFNFAFTAELLGLLEEAETGFRSALAIEEKMDRAWYGLAVVLVRQGRLPEALVALKRNTTLQPMSPFGWYQLAKVHVDLEQPDEARKVIRHLKGFEPKVAAQLERETGLRLV